MRFFLLFVQLSRLCATACQLCYSIDTSGKKGVESVVHALAARFARYLVARGVTGGDDAEVVEYGVFHILSSALQLTILLVPALLLGIAPEMAAFTLCFMSLKQYAGGAHAEKHWVCVAGFTALAFGMVYAGRLLSHISGLAVMISALGFILVLLKAPAPHYNNPKTKAELRMLRKKAISVAAVQLVLVSLALPEWAAVFRMCSACGGTSAAVSLLFVSMEKGGGETVEGRNQ